MSSGRATLLEMMIKRFISHFVPIFVNSISNKLRGFSPLSELYRSSDHRLSAKLVPTLADEGCRVVSATIPPQSLISVF
jgi:hypothetical protein